jgi:hypothetical protein
MKSKNYLQSGVKELTIGDLYSINGGGFAYDFGFFLREMFIYAVNGGSGPGSVAVGVDLGINYKPVAQ